MKQNKYDDPTFFEKYSRMNRSKEGLEGAGEWHALRSLLPDMTGKRLLDLGCGYGWHCIYALEAGAASALGIDISERMLDVAREKSAGLSAEYRCIPIEDIDFPGDSFDLVLSSLAFHYVADFPAVCNKVAGCLAAGGEFIFSVEHPVFTAFGTQDWHRDERGDILHWPVDHYFTEGPREAVFLGEAVTKYHRTLTTYLNALMETGFAIAGIVEPKPPESMMDLPGMADELRRPMMLIIKAKKL